MTTEEPEHPNLTVALIAALAELTVVEPTQTADMGSYSYKYAALPEVVKETRKTLAAHGLVVLTPVRAYENGLECTVIVLHTSGERLDLGPLPFPHGRDAQATGSMITYHRRYALLAALGMATGEDDDGAAAKPRVADPASSDEALSVIRSRIDRLRNYPGAVEELQAEWREHSELPKLDELRQSQEGTVLRLITAVEKKAEAAEAERTRAVEAVDDAPEASEGNPDPHAVPDPGVPPVQPASTETAVEAPETPAAPVEVVPPPFNPDGLPEGYTSMEDLQWTERAPEGWLDEVVEEVATLSAGEARSRVKAFGLPNTGGDEAVRKRLTFRLVRRRMEKALTP